MTQTDFCTHGPRQLIDDHPTEILAQPQRWQRRSVLPLLRWIDELTTSVDASIEAHSIDATPLSLEPGWTASLVAAAEQSGSADNALRDRALTALDEVRSVLAISEAQAASLVGVARNTVASWRRREREPYPATLRRLLEVHSIISAVTALHGSDDARNWFYGPMADGRSRVDALRLPEGTQLLTSELRSSLFPGTGPRTLPATDEVDDEPAGEPPEPAVGGFDQPIVKSRPAP